jgi:tRNA A37 threonylcarbamoyladenosine dehydratase
MIDQMCPQLTLCVDAIDGHIEKSSLIAACCVRGIPLVSCGGSAGRSDPTLIRVDDLSRVSDCRLLFQCKKRLRDYYRLFAKGPANHEKGDKIWKSRKWNIRTVYSTEVIDTNTNSHHDETIDLNNVNAGVTCNVVSMKNDSFIQETSSLRMCDNGNLGTACFVTGAFGFFAASEVVSMIAKNELKRPRILKTHWLASTDMVHM